MLEQFREWRERNGLYADAVSAFLFAVLVLGPVMLVLAIIYTVIIYA